MIHITTYNHPAMAEAEGTNTHQDTARSRSNSNIDFARHGNGNKHLFSPDSFSPDTPTQVPEALKFSGDIY